MKTTIEQDMYNELIKKLEEESATLTPMLRSAVYMKVIAIGDNIVPHLLASITGDTEKHYLSLLAISEIKPATLQKIPKATRLKIYMKALQKAGPHNDWGVAGEYLSGASLDIVKIGNQAVPFLAPMLDDSTKAGIWGSEEATINARYQNRVCDFAYYLILHILDRVEPYAEMPAERYKAIERLKQNLDLSSLGEL